MPYRTTTHSVVTGKITVAGSDRGVPGVVVEAHHVLAGGDEQRLGSAVSTGQGTFSIEVRPPGGQLAALFRRAPVNLQLRVFAPEGLDGDRARRPLFVSETRTGVVGAEEFRIGLPADALDAAGVPVPTDADTTARPVAAAIDATGVRADVFRHATDRIFTTRFDTVATRRTLFRDHVLDRIKAELTTVTDAERASDRFVADDGEIEAKHLAAVAADVAALVDEEQPVRASTNLLLSERDLAAVFDGSTEPRTLTEEELEHALGATLDKPAVVYRRHVEPDPCRPAGDIGCCLDDDDDHDHDHEDEDGGGGGGAEGAAPAPPPAGDHAGANVAFDGDAAIAMLLARQTPPEAPVEFGDDDGDLEGTLTAGGVADAISGVTLAPGPADVPAFYDFHDLQVAFAPVWQEALDDRFLHDVERAYDEIVERGGAPAIDKIGGILTAPRPSFIRGLLDSIWDIGSAADSEVPAAVAAAVHISLDEWRVLPASSRTNLSALATRIEDLREAVIDALDPANLEDLDTFNVADLIRAANTKQSIALRAQIELLNADAERIVAHARRLLLDREAKEAFRPTHEIIDRLRSARGSSYPFRFFAASPQHRSVNFGIMVTYRQLWTPVSYQVGELVSTIPLAPKEVRRFSKRTVVRTKRSMQEIETNMASRRMESEERSRAEAEIVARATAKTNFSLTKSGSVSIGEGAAGGSATTNSAFTRDAERHSQTVKREFREAVLKSAEEYKSERKVEVSTEETFESEVTESGEIQNPNDEIPVTFLFYELQRRFKVSEKLHRLQSVVLVAQEVPSPASIDSAWLIRHDWILNRVLLDDSFRPALGYASTTMISEEVVLREMRQALFRQRKLVEELKEDIEDRRAMTGLRYAALQRQIERTAASAGGGGGLFGGLGSLVGGIPVVGDLVQGGLDLLGGGEEAPSQSAQLREGAARDAFDREKREEEQLASRLHGALSSLESMQRDFTERLGQHLRHVAQVERLISHVVQNISYYMQAIWAYEPDDQRYLRLRNVPVPVFEKDKSSRRWLLDPAAIRLVDRIPAKMSGIRVTTDAGIFDPPTRPQDIKTRPLSEVADLNRPLGFLGNYFIFPMIEANPITEFMMDPYVTVAEGEYGVSDPDPLGNLTLDEFCEYVCCLKKEVGDDAFAGMKDRLRAALKDLLQRSLRNDDEVVVPSNNLYIEALPGAHSVMEKFKHLHRQLDVKTAQEQLRRTAIDNVRRAERILDDELEDPDIEAKYVFEGDGSATVVPPVPPGGPGPGGGNP